MNKDQEEAIKAAMNSLPSTTHLSQAWTEGADEEYPDLVGAVFSFSETGLGFGEITILATKDGTFVDSECMSPSTVKRLLERLLEGAIYDHDKDPDKHARYNKAMRRTCSDSCTSCILGSNK